MSPDGPALFRVQGQVVIGNRDDICLACHADAAWGASSRIAALHPQHIAPQHSHVNVSLVPTDELGQQRMGCRTCHDPHGGADPVHLARVGPDEPTQELCLKCHEEKQYIKYTGHSAEKLAAASVEVDSCKPCHAMHAAPGSSWGLVLSPRFLMERCLQVAGQTPVCLPCLACHQEAGPAPLREYITHPEMLMMNINEPTDPGYLPLFNADGREDAQGQVVCRTCHVSHGRLDLLKLMAERPHLTPEEKHAIRARVRSFVPPNVCTACHGEEARNRFLHFHDGTLRRSTTAPTEMPR